MFTVLRISRRAQNALNRTRINHNVSKNLSSTDSTQSFRTVEDNPQNHSKSNLAQFYSVKPNIKKQLYAHGGLTKSFEQQVNTFTETCFMIRKPAVDIINCLKNTDFSKPVNRFVLYGKKGAGKSISLAHIVHYGHESGFLLVHVPWVGNWMRRSKDYSNSELKEGYTDLNLDAASWLQHFKTQNHHMLSNPDFKVSKTYTWNKRETTQKDAPLSELIDHGINRVKYASSVVLELCNEIKILSTQGVCKTLVAIDGFNAFFYPETRVFTEKKEVVHPSKITLTEGFLNLTKYDWKNGAVVVTVDELAIAQKHQLSHMPKYLLGETGFKHLDPFVPVEVPEYNTKELTSCINYYRERKWIQNVPGQEEELAFLSASNPYKLMEITAAL